MIAKAVTVLDLESHSVLAELGIVGMEPIEPVVLAALITAEPLLLIGPHGTAKSYLLNRISRALGLEWRHYNASLLNFDDLIGYPLPDAHGGLRYVQTPASIWDAQTVFLDEISRCRPELQNKLFSIIHERRVQGMELTKLVYRWSAMNPPASDADDDYRYRGSEPLDQALADRFALVVEMPTWEQFSEEQQQRVILAADGEIDPTAARRLRARIQSGRAIVAQVREAFGVSLAAYVRIVLALFRQADLALSPRRGGMLLRNIVAMHAARLVGQADASLEESALLALTHSLPERALGIAISPLKLQTVHREAWTAAALDTEDPRRILLLEPDPLRRAWHAAQVPALAPDDFSTVVADALAALPLGAVLDCRSHVHPRVHLFSTQVVDISLAELRDGVCRTTDGTSIECVAEHLEAHRIRRAVLLTDGFVGRPRGSAEQTLARVHLGVALITGTSTRQDLERVTDHWAELPAMKGAEHV